ncbi:Polysialic acid transport protein kpsM [Moraxella ovis]|uniref:Polysialic acid transport protein kpsM n=1 Tax=Moraxella ovis TaxID=29433 RepID=A0A378PJ88_9GAMM|nr:Polysialic acid transport protein kpsM [Moraxella ovis]
MILMIVGHYDGELSKVISIVFTILYFISGVLYSAHMIPEPYLSYLMYNPFIHNLDSSCFIANLPDLSCEHELFYQMDNLYEFFRLAFV